MKVLKLGLSLCSSNGASGAAAYENLYSLSYDGVDDYLDLGSGAALSPNSSGANRGFSLSIWVKAGVSQQILGTFNGYQLRLDVRWNGNPIMYFYGNGNPAIYQRLNIDTSIADSNWHHLVYTFDLSSSTSSIVGYLDGAQKTNGSGATYASAGTWSAVTNNGSLRMATDGGTTFGLSEQDEFSIFDDVLTAAQVTTIYNSGNTEDVSSIPYLVGWWRNGDPNGTASYPTITDDSTNSNNGTMTNMTSSDITTNVP